MERSEWAEHEDFQANPITLGQRPDSPLGQRVHDEGLIFAINRLVLHPVGLAIGVYGELDDDDRHHIKTVKGVSLFATDDPEGIIYASDGQIEAGLAKLREAGHEALADHIEALPREATA